MLLTNIEEMIEAAKRHGENMGLLRFSYELEDLRKLLRTAFELLSEDGKAQFFKSEAAQYVWNNSYGE